MKVTVSLFFGATLVLSVVLHHVAIILPFAFAVLFGLYGVTRSASRRLNPMNDVPNTFRVFLASLGGFLLTLYHSFVLPSFGIVLFFGSLYLNDEYQRRALDSLRVGRKGGAVALLGIDGSGKSTHSAKTSAWLEARGYRVKLMPFHKYLFVERLSALSSSGRGAAGGRRRRNPLRPLLSLVDNLILQMASSIGCRLEGTVVIYDRFIWSTYIKYEALGYPVKALAPVYLLPRPYYAIVLDVPVDKSLRVIDERAQHTRYSRTVLEHERERYLEVARTNRYPIIDATASFEDVQSKIEAHLARLFPQVSGGRRA
jgi:dTMP kinase